MHKYLRAIGFSNIRTKQDLKHLLDYVEEYYQSEHTGGGVPDFSERKKEFAPGLGIALCGEYDEKEDYTPEYYFPYHEGTIEKFYDDVSIERHAEKESYSGICDDLCLGVTLIFYVQNASDYLYHKRLLSRGFKNSGMDAAIKNAFKKTFHIKFSALSVEGKILLPIVKENLSEEQTRENLYRHTQLVQAARQGNEDAIQNLTMEDMDTYSMIAERAVKEDIYSIVSSCFMPYGVECDHYSIIGEIMKMKSVENSMTGEKIYILTVNSHDMDLEICINQADLLGEPKVGRRFKGIVWIQGQIVF